MFESFPIINERVRNYFDTTFSLRNKQVCVAFMLSLHLQRLRNSFAILTICFCFGRSSHKYQAKPKLLQKFRKF